MQLDDTDRKILRILLQDGSTSKAEIARLVGLTSTAIAERLRKLHERGVIEGYSVRLNARVLGCNVLAFVSVSEAKPLPAQKTAPRLAQLSSVEEVHRVAGRDCFLLKVRATDMDHLAMVLDEIGNIKSVAALETTIVLETFLEKTFDTLPE